MKKVLATIAIASALIGTIQASAEESEPTRVFLLGQQLDFDVNPVIVNGTTLVQFRPIFEKLGYDITWDEKTKKITGKKDGTVIEMTLGVKAGTVNKQGKALEVAPQLIDGNTMVPIRFVGEASGKIVKWNEIAKAVEIVKGVEKIGTYLPYYGDSYLDLDGFTRFPNITPWIFERDGMTFVVWAKDETFKGESATNFYVSVAKDGKWTVKNQLMSHQRKNVTGVRYNYFYEDGAIYWRDDLGIKKITPNEYGYSSDFYVLDNEFVSTEPEIYTPLYVNGEMGFLGNINGKFRIYPRNGSSYVEVKDVHGLLKSVGTQNKLIYDENSKILSVFTGANYKQLNVETGDMLFDESGKDKVVSITTTPQVMVGNSFFSNGNLYFFYREGSEQFYRYGYYDSNLKFNPISVTQIKSGEIENKSMSISDKEIRIWSSKLYERKPSLELTSYAR